MISYRQLSAVSRNWTSAEARPADRRLKASAVAEARSGVIASAASPPSAETAADSFEVRWTRWRVEAAAQDALWRRGVLVAGVLIGCGLAAWLGAGS